jgi:Protein of unknown function (DUF1203)
MPFRFVALETELVKRLQAGGLDANGQEPERHISAGGMVPCRHCLQDVEAGEPYLILAHRPFPAAQPYAEQGPIFLHAKPCARHAETENAPRMFLERKAYLIRGYGADNRIVYGTGRIVAPTLMGETARQTFRNPNVSYIHVRSASNNCYQCRIDRPDARMRRGT